ncbi:hypothetical protein [Methylobacterium sp. Leaf118]|uniref:hypothetical protein n=1 Tax=Methylobacterium sp. Leaf118 TaxID=2876562 RepID=UPI001E63D6F4|nr:hypothetical protein [Methylobacterium sp. Leaf118]
MATADDLRAPASIRPWSRRSSGWAVLKARTMSPGSRRSPRPTIASPPSSSSADNEDNLDPARALPEPDQRRERYEASAAILRLAVSRAQEDDDLRVGT